VIRYRTHHTVSSATHTFTHVMTSCLHLEHHHSFDWQTIPIKYRVKGLVGLADWLHIKVVCPPKDAHWFQH